MITFADLTKKIQETEKKLHEQIDLCVWELLERGAKMGEICFRVYGCPMRHPSGFLIKAEVSLFGGQFRCFEVLIDEDNLVCWVNRNERAIKFVLHDRPRATIH